MPRKGEVPKRKPLPDPKFTDPPSICAAVTKFVNTVMRDGKKSVAEHIVYGAFDLIAEQRQGRSAQGLGIARSATCSPSVEVKSRRVGGSTYQVPVDVRPDRSLALGMRWLVDYARDRGEKTMQEKLAGEIIDAVRRTAATRSRSAKTCTRWRTPTRRSRTTAGRLFESSPRFRGGVHASSTTAQTTDLTVRVRARSHRQPAIVRSAERRKGTLGSRGSAHFP